MSADPFEIAVEHIAYCISQRMQPIDVFQALKAPPPRYTPTWNDAIWACARIASDKHWGDMPDAVAVCPAFPAPKRKAA